MKKIFQVMLLLAPLFLIPSYSYSSNLGAIRISLVEGDVQIYTEDTSEWVAAAINMPLKEGDRIWVPGGGKVELQLNEGTSIRLNEDSSLEILRTERNSFQFYLNTGRAYVNFRGLRNSLLQCDTPVSSIRAYESAIFRLDVTDDKYTDISVDKGLLYAESRSGSTKVREGYTLSIRGDDYADLHPLEPSDKWEDWNEERDSELYKRRNSLRYLPDELSPYSYDFDRYGKWVYVREYGHVWTPTFFASVGWAPYRHGRWVWIAGDYVWVSYEPWGWVPYHYGRWIFNISIGWCWVPPIRGAIYWGPGFVSWVYTPEYLAWVPLAPGEIYYGHGYFGPFSVNITNVDINKIKLKKVYKNVYVDNAVTVIPRKAFAKGKPEPLNMRIRENPFLKEKINIGRPETRPGEVPSIKQPPSKIGDIKMPLRPGEVRAPIEKKMERPGSQRTPMERWSERNSDPRNKRPESHEQFNNPWKGNSGSK